ncbi:MAG TPA: putative 2OG-Fe(II) oxygenase [Caulobacteraceae bacterium]|nr:putative 2OG-Fe(II) oxygenase [Caulobacteraceae bacterium]
MTDARLAGFAAQADALRAAGRLESAIALYETIIEEAPDDGYALHNLAAALGDDHRFNQCEQVARRAFTKGIDAPETWLVLARALQGLGRFDEADDAFRQAIRRRPAYVQAHRDLAQLLWMRGQSADVSSQSIDRALASAPLDAPLLLTKAKVLEYAGQPDAAYRLIVRAIGMGAGDARLETAAAMLTFQTDPEASLAHAERAIARDPLDEAALTALCQANLALGRADAALEVAAFLRERSPDDQRAVALQATAWRLMGDPRYRALFDYERLVRAWTIDTPPGWRTLDAYLADLTESLHALHRLRAHPIGQSLRGGVQTTQNLDRVDDPAVKALFQALAGPIRRHIEAIGERGEPRFNGVWSVRLQPGGFHINHLHPMGWISSACYVSVPKQVERGHEGWLQFGEPGTATSPPLSAEHFVKPEPGRLVLFPSYMWHGTVPFAGDEPRLSVAFDLVRATP